MYTDVSQGVRKVALSAFLTFLFELKQSAAESHQTVSKAYGDAGLSNPTCRFCDFDINGKERPEKRTEKVRTQ